MESMDKIHGQSPAGVLEQKQWTISCESMENVHGFFPLCPWIFPWNPWILSREIVDNVHGNYPWTMSLSMESMEIIYGPLSSRLWSVDPDKSPE